MCHHFTRDRAVEEDSEDDEVLVEIDDELIEPLEEERAEDVELLTDGSGEE